jgi:uncharacterized membrane protein (GlpM family)
MDRHGETSIPPYNFVVGGINITLSEQFQNITKFYQQLTGEERRIPFIFDDFHFCRSRVIGLDMTENMIFTLCRMITWVVFLRMLWNFISSLLMKRGGSLSFLTIFHFCHSRVIGLDMMENRIFTLCRMITWVVFLRMFWNFICSLPVKRGGSLSFLTIFTFAIPELLDLIWRKIGFLRYVAW